MLLIFSGDFIMAKFRNIGVLTSGGDAPGMNALTVRSPAALEQGVGYTAFMIQVNG